MPMSLGKGPRAAIGDHRFDNPFTVEDIFNNLPISEGDIDLLSLKPMAEEHAIKRVDEILTNNEINDRKERICSLLSLRRYRKWPIEYIDLGKPEFIKQMTSLKTSEKLSLTLSFFPTKIINPLKTFAKKWSEVDMWEFGTILRLYEIAFALSKIWKDAGAKFIITCDGLKYNKAFSFDHNQVVKYAENIQKIIDYLGINEYIELTEETSLYPKDYDICYNNILQKITTEFQSGNEDIHAQVYKLAESIAYNIPQIRNIDIKTLSLAYNPRISAEELEEISQEAIEVRECIEKVAQRVSLEYIAIYEAAYQANIYKTHMPKSLKATVHPKPQQVSIYTINSSIDVFGHHGQGTFKDLETEGNLDRIRVKFAWDILRQNNIKWITLDPEKYPFADPNHPFIVIKEDIDKQSNK